MLIKKFTKTCTKDRLKRKQKTVKNRWKVDRQFLKNRFNFELNVDQKLIKNLPKLAPKTASNVDKNQSKLVEKLINNKPKIGSILSWTLTKNWPECWIVLAELNILIDGIIFNTDIFHHPPPSPLPLLSL